MFAQDANMHIRLVSAFIGPVLLGVVAPVLFASVVPDKAPATAKACSSAASNPVESASACGALGMIDLAAGNNKAAEAKFREAIAMATPALGESHPDVAVYQSDLAVALAADRQYGRAEVLLHRAQYVLNATLPPGDARLATVLAELSAVESAEKEFARAEADAEQSLAIVARGHAPETLDVAVQRVVLASVYIRERKLADADRMLTDAVALERRLVADAGSSDRRILANGIRKLAELRAVQHNWRDSEALFRETIGIYESTAGPSHPMIAPILMEYAEVLKHCGVPKEQVKNVESRAKAILMTKA
jgi:tetratricopeptide (TPR) repeat protein